MASVTTSKTYDATQFHAHAGITRSTFADGVISTDELTQEQLEAAEASYTYDPVAAQALAEAATKPLADWRTKLETERAWLQNEVSTAPAQGTTTQGNAVARVDALIQHQKRIDRDLIRLITWILDGGLDSGD